MKRLLQLFLIVALCLVNLLGVGQRAGAQAVAPAQVTAPAADDPLLRSAVLDEGSNTLLVTSEPFCTAPPAANNNPPYPYDPNNCPTNPVDPANDKAIATFQQIYKLTGPSAANQRFTLGNRVEERVDQNQAAAGRRRMDSIAVDLTGQGIDTFVSAWEGPTQTVKIFISQAISTTLQERRLTLDAPLAPGNSGDTNGHIHLAAGDLTGDGAEEFVVAFQGADAKIHLTAFANRGDSLPQVLATVADEALPLTPLHFARFGLTLGDFDGDDKAEVALAYVRQNPNNPDNWSVFLRVYDLVGDQLQPKVGQTVFTAPPKPNNTFLADVNLVLTSGDFDQNGAAEVAVVTGRQLTVQDVDPGGDDTFLTLVKLGDNLGTPTVDPLEAVTKTTLTGLDILQPDRNSPTDVAAADLNNDGRIEIVLAVGPDIILYSVDNQLNATQQLRYDTMKNGMPAVQLETHQLGYRVLGVRPVGGGRVEIALAAPTVSPSSGSMRQSMNLVVYTATSNLQNLTLVASQLDSNPIVTEPNDYRHFALAVGGPTNLQLGNYSKKGTATAISQPLIVVKAPPTHFDLFGDESFDVSDCFPEDVRLACGGLYDKFTATFSQGSQQQRSISTQLNSDWAIAESLSGNLSAIGISLAANLKKTYGEGFEKIQGTTATYTDVTEDYVWQDDRILASVVDYDVYEFEVLTNGQVVGHVLVVRPRGTPQMTWFGAKDWTGYAFIPDSQPGNILSYAESVEEIRTTGNFAQRIMPDNRIQTQTISRDTSFGTTRSITYQEDVEQADTKTRTLEMEVGAKLGGSKDFGKVTAGLEIGVENTYSKKEISTQKVNLGEWFGVKLVYGNINSTITDANYRITPYLYWAANGAVVVDYAVQPELSRPGFPAGWWQTHYGEKADPAFLLPWRHDEARLGYATPAYKLNLTKDILFDPPNAQALETVTIVARLHNYSLRETATPPVVRFYLGDPDAGGTPLVGVNGETSVTAAGNIPARGSAIVTFPWRVPEGLRYPRIYALIDPDGAIAEVHEDNNKAFAILGAYDGSGPPLAGFAPSPASNANPLAVTFRNASSGEYTGILWDFGDGVTSADPNPTHTYTAPGDYLVTLTLTGGIDGTSDVVQQRVRVGVAPVTGNSLYLPLVTR
jgi:hypothetical protein